MQRSPSTVDSLASPSTISAFTDYDADGTALNAKRCYRLGTCQIVLGALALLFQLVHYVGFYMVAFYLPSAGILGALVRIMCG